MTNLIVFLTSETDGFLILCFLLSCALGFIVFVNMNKSKIRVKKGLRDSPAKEVHNVKEGEYARIHGEVQEQAQMLIAPLTGTSCVFYKVEILERNKNRYALVKEELNYIPFYISAGRAKAKVAPKSAGVITHHLLSREGGHGTNKKYNFSRENIDAFLKKYRIKTTHGILDFDRDFRYVEYSLVPGERIAVKGIAKWNIDPQTKARELELHGTYDVPLLISDDPQTLRILPKRK